MDVSLNGFRWHRKRFDVNGVACIATHAGWRAAPAPEHTQTEEPRDTEQRQHVALGSKAKENQHRTIQLTILFDGSDGDRVSRNSKTSVNPSLCSLTDLILSHLLNACALTHVLCRSTHPNT